MNPMKRVGLAVLFLIVGVLCAASPALAGKPIPTSGTRSYQLVPPESSPEPQASGKWIDKWELYSTWPELTYIHHLTVTCVKLTPGKQYHVCFGSYWDWWTYPATADSKGRLCAEIVTLDSLCWVENDEGAIVLVPEWY